MTRQSFSDFMVYNPANVTKKLWHKEKKWNPILICFYSVVQHFLVQKLFFEAENLMEFYGIKVISTSPCDNG